MDVTLVLKTSQCPCYPSPVGVRLADDLYIIKSTVIILSFWTDMPGQTVQTQIRQQSDQGLHCLQFRLHLLNALLYSKAILFKF